MLLSIIGYFSFLIYKVDSVGKKITIRGVMENPKGSFLKTIRSFTTLDAKESLRGFEEGRLNILLLGTAGKGKPGQNLTDTLMILSVNPQNSQVAFLSLPRDLYVPVPFLNFGTKINSVYQLGLNNAGKDPRAAAEIILKTVEDVTSLKLHYYAILNFDGFEKIIDSLGGINVQNERDIYDPSYPGPNYSYEIFELKKGLHHLDGKTALRYARERHDDPEGDFGRAKRQQQIMEAAKNKFFSAGTLLNVFSLNEIFNALGENIVTDIAPEEFTGFLELVKNLDTRNATNVVLDAWKKDSLLKVYHVPTQNGLAFALVPRTGNWIEIQEMAKNIFQLEQLEKKRAKIQKEEAHLTIINKSGDFSLSEKIRKLLGSDLNYKNASLLTDKNSFAEEKSVVIDLTNGQKPFSLEEIATKLPAAVSYQVPAWLKETLNDQEADLVVVIGKDLINSYNKEEGTLEDLEKTRAEEEATEF
ncbi:LCP family protein [Patescibacteria group bacterium]|nr:LCP family protein [Patescibacteria group bacterium]